MAASQMDWLPVRWICCQSDELAVRIQEGAGSERGMLNSSMVLCEKYLFVFLLLLLLLFFLFFFFFHLLGGGIIGSLFAIFRGLWVTSLLARALSEPLGKLPGWPLHPFVALLLPDLVELGQPFVSESTLVHFLPVVIGSGVSSALILGVHPYLGWVVSNKGIGVESLLQGLLSQLGLLPFLEFLEGEELFSLLSQLIRSQFFEGEGLDSDAKSDLLLFFELLLGFAHFLAGITGVSVTLGCLSEASLLFLLCLKHGLSLGLGFFQQLLLGFGLLLPRLLLLFLLLLVEFLLLLGPDLFPLGLFVLELLQLLLFGFPRFLPFCDVFLEGFVKGSLSLSWILNLSHDLLLCDFL